MSSDHGVHTRALFSEPSPAWGIQGWPRLLQRALEEVATVYNRSSQEVQLGGRARPSCPLQEGSCLASLLTLTDVQHAGDLRTCPLCPWEHSAGMTHFHPLHLDAC